MHHKLLLITILLFTNFFASAQDKTDDQKGSDEDNINKTSTNNLNTVGLIKVTDSIFMLKGRGGNIGLSIGKDGIFMIDDQFAEASENILQRIRSISNKPIELLVNTHHHEDHIGGNSTMTDLGAVVFSHENARRRIAEPYINAVKADRQKKMDSMAKQYGGKITSDIDKKNVYREIEKSLGSLDNEINIPSGLLPVVSFSENLTFNYNGEKIIVLHVPNAHTDGDVIVYFTKSNVLHTGDVFFNGTYPLIDTESRGSLKGYIAGLDKILTLINNGTKIIPGHGNLATINDVQYTKSMFRFLTEKIAYHVVDNKTEEEVVAMSDLTKEYDDKGFGEGSITTESFIRTLYKETAKKYHKKTK